MGFANEWGSVYLPELEPYIMSSVKGEVLNEIMPPAGYYWEDEHVKSEINYPTPLAEA